VAYYTQYLVSGGIECSNSWIYWVWSKPVMAKLQTECLNGKPKLTGMYSKVPTRQFNLTGPTEVSD